MVRVPSSDQGTAQDNARLAVFAAISAGFPTCALKRGTDGKQSRSRCGAKQPVIGRLAGVWAR